jgi:hypothetical protein
MQAKTYNSEQHAYILYDTRKKFVPDTRKSSGLSAETAEAVAPEQYKKHLHNYYILNTIRTNETNNFYKRQQASNEIDACDKKLKFWERYLSVPETIDINRRTQAEIAKQLPHYENHNGKRVFITKL